jgi:PIN domain nuclease of toxin-antitoxin system
MADLAVDTHAALWYLLDQPRLSARALDALDESAGTGDYLFLSAISLIEVRYLVDKGKLPPITIERLEMSLHGKAPAFVIVPVDLSVARSVGLIPRIEVPDMPDRIIAGTALILGVPLVTRDRAIQSSQIQTVW